MRRESGWMEKVEGRVEMPSEAPTLVKIGGGVVMPERKWKRK